MFADLFAFHVSPLELVLRGTLVYWLLFLIFRFIMRRDVGAVGIADILLLVIIADASQNAMAGGYQTVGEGAVLVLTIIGWNWLLDWLQYRFEAVRRFTEPRKLKLVERGRPLLRNMRREFITMDELNSKLRDQGLEKVADVKAAYLEVDGQISVIKYEPGEDAARRETRIAGSR